MAEIGVMKKLTIGGKTYTIPEYSLPIASASTLGGVRVGTGLVIESGTGILSATGTDVTIDSEMSSSSTNPVQNQVVKAYVDQYKGTVTSITLTQGTGITVSNSGTAITTSGSRTISLASITKSDTTSTASPSYGGTFTAIDSITYDTYGRVTGINTKTITLPADSNTDTKVTQAYSTANNSYPVLFSATAGVSSTSSRGATTAILNNAIYANPSTGDLHVTKLNGVAVGTSPKFTDTTYTNVSEFTNDAGYITSADVPEGASAYTGTISAVGTTASNGTNNGFARGDHVHNITSSTITSALGYTPYNSTNPNGYISSYTDEQLKWTASTSSNTYYPLQSTSTATTSTANTLNGISFYQYYNTAGGYRRLDLGNSTAYKSTGGAYGTIRLYGAAATYYGDLVPGVLGTTTGDGHISANRTWTLPDKTGTIALTSDIPSYTDTNTTYTLTNALSSHKFTWTLTAGGSGSGSTTTTVELAAGTGITLTDDTTNKKITIASNLTVPTKTSDLTNDSGFITTDSDEKVKSTPATAATTYYLIASTSSSENTATTSKHASLIAYTTADSGTSGYTELRLGNTTATSSAGGKEGTIRLYGTNATYYTTLKAGAVASSNKTITFPNATGTVALTSDLSNFVTSSGVTSIATTSPISGGTITSTGTISHATSGVGNAVTTAGFYKFKYDTYGHVTGVTAVAASDITGLVTIPTNTDENVKSTAVTAATTNYIVGSTTSSTTTGGLSKHASGVLYTTADTATSGYTQLRLGNTTATTTAGGKEGQIRLYATSATYYVDLKAGAVTSNRTVTLPTKTGTLLVFENFNGGDSDSSSKFYAPTSAGTSGYYLKSSGSGAPTWAAFPTDADTTYTLSGALSSHKFTSTITAGGSGSGTSTSDFTLAAGTGITITDNTSTRTMTIACSVTNTDAKVTQTTDSGSNWRKILASYNSGSAASTSITSGTTDTSYYNNNVSMQPSTGSIYVGGSYYMYLNENVSDALYSAISDLGWTTDVIE